VVLGLLFLTDWQGFLLGLSRAARVQVPVRSSLVDGHRSRVAERCGVTVIEHIHKIQGDLRDGALTPDLTRESLVQLTALLGNVSDEQRAADSEFKIVLLDAMRTESKANRARIVAETSPQYARAREAKDTATLVQEMIRSCRAYLRSLDEEMRLAR
jgi:hypothetical protein